jgi:hypothetical protein
VHELGERELWIHAATQAGVADAGGALEVCALAAVARIAIYTAAGSFTLASIIVSR